MAASDATNTPAVNTMDEGKIKAGDGIVKGKPETKPKPKQGESRQLRVYVALLTQRRSQGVILPMNRR